MSRTLTSPSPSDKTQAALRFPLATLTQVRREIARQVSLIRHAKWWFLLAVVLLILGSYATVLVPQLMGQIVDLVTGEVTSRSMLRIGVELIVIAVVLLWRSRLYTGTTGGKG